MIVNEQDGEKPQYRVNPDSPFPITGMDELQSAQGIFGQRTVYRGLVDSYGREITIERLGTFLPPEVVRLQLSVLCPEEEI